MRKLGIVGLMAVLLAGLVPMTVDASANCTASLPAPVVFKPGSYTELKFEVLNVSGADITWFQVSRPNEDYVVDSVSVDGWSTSGDLAGATFTDGVLAQGETAVVTIWAHSNAWEAGPAAWTARASDNSSGAGAVNCSGSRSTSVHIDLPPESEGQGISGVTVDTTTTSAIVQWQSAAPTGSVVIYGETTGYGSYTLYDQDQTANHLVVISDLKLGTTYHFRVAGIDSDEALWYSASATFATAGGTSPGTGTGGQLPAPGQTSGAPVTQPGSGGAVVSTEKVAPVVAVTTKLVGAYRDAPVVQGTASDNVAVSAVEYSVDGGKNWSVAQVSEVAQTTGSSRRRTTTSSRANVRFEFTPVLIEDGNYTLVVRATDSSGNRTMSPAMTLVIDRLPPRMANGLVTLGSQVIAQDGAGRWPAVAGVEQTMSLNAVGGPTRVTLQATKAGSKLSGQSFQLQRNNQTGLWTGVVQFQTAGEYALRTEAVDGAGNRTTSGLPGFVVTAAARVVDAKDQVVKDAKVTLYYREPQSGEWVVWDGSAFGQANPQKPETDGAFRLLVPPGTYYLRAEAPGYRTLVSSQFEARRPLPLVPTLRLKARPSLKLGPLNLVLPWITLGRTDLKLGDDGVEKASGGLIGKAMPAPNYPTTRGATSTVGLIGKPSVITVLSTWSPVMSEQLPALAALQPNRQFNVVPLVMGERLSRVRAHLERSGYTLSVTVDEQAALSSRLGTLGAPTHYFVDGRGVVREVVTGVLSQPELEAVLERF